ncbi:MAG: hypothetical protein ACD_75C00990G0001, partial [uncultured bacterium]
MFIQQVEVGSVGFRAGRQYRHAMLEL